MKTINKTNLIAALTQHRDREAITSSKAKHTYNCVMNAMAEDTHAAMCHTFAALTQQAKSVALQSGKFANTYILGASKAMPVDEAAKELTAKAAALVSCKLRKIDLIIAEVFLSEYISRQRKKNEPKPTKDKNAANEALNFSAKVRKCAEKAGFNNVDLCGTCRAVLFYRDKKGYDIKNSKGEILCVEVVRCENPGGANSLPKIWYKNGWTKTELRTWWAIDVSVYDINGRCWIRYNPQIVQGTHRIDFNWMKEATGENLAAILAEVLNRFNA